MKRSKVSAVLGSPELLVKRCFAKRYNTEHEQLTLISRPRRSFFRACQLRR